MLQWEHSAILSTFIRLPFVIKIFVLSILSGRFTQVLLYVPNPMSVSYFFREFILSKAAAEHGDNSVSKKAESQHGHPNAQQDDKSMAKKVESKQDHPNAQQGDSVSKKGDPKKGQSKTQQGDDSGPKKAMSKQEHSNTNDFYMFFVRFVLIECLVIVLHYSIFGKL